MNIIINVVITAVASTLLSVVTDIPIAIAGALWIWRTTFRKDLMLAFLLFLLIGNVAGFLRWKWSKTAKQE